MRTHAVTCQFTRDPGSEHLASTSVEADVEAVLFSWTDQEGRGYEVQLRDGDRLVATLRFDGRERDIATEELDLQCRALGLTREARGHVGFSLPQELITMATDPKDHPLHQVPEHLPRPPGDLPPGSAPPLSPPQQQPPGTVPLPDRAGPFAGEVENEAGDPVGKPPRL